MAPVSVFSLRGPTSSTVRRCAEVWLPESSDVLRSCDRDPTYLQNHKTSMLPFDNCWDTIWNYSLLRWSHNVLVNLQDFTSTSVYLDVHIVPRRHLVSPLLPPHTLPWPVTAVNHHLLFLDISAKLNYINCSLWIWLISLGRVFLGLIGATDCISIGWITYFLKKVPNLGFSNF